MKSNILSEVFAELCESQTHFDSLLSRVNPSQKSKVAVLLGAFLRRPATIATHFGIELAPSAAEFWSASFIRMKKNQGIHQCFEALWEKWETIPNEGSVEDFPVDFIQKLEKDWGVEKTKAMARLLSQDPLTTIRFHRRAYENGVLKPEIEAWLKEKEHPKSRAGNYTPNARIFRGFARVQRNDWFEKGYFEIQDEGSQFMSLYSLYPEFFGGRLKDAPQTEKFAQTDVSNLPDLGPITVVDACSGAGGKTLALADGLKGKGRIYAYDVYERKVRSLKQRAERAQERNIQGVLVTPADYSSIQKFENTADVVLVDAPCSGYGVLRRNPDTKWPRKPFDEKKRDSEIPLPELQLKVLEAYSKYVKPEGRLVFGVCTFLKEESLEPVQAFLKNHSEFELQSEGYLGPYDTDGFFMASLKKHK